MELAADAAATIRAEYQPQRGDYFKAAVLSSARSMPNAAFGTALTCMALLAIILTGDRLSVLILVAGVAGLTGLWSLPFLALALRRRPDLFLGPHELTADADGVRFATASARSEQGWPTFRRVREVGGAFLLDYGTGANALIPARAFDPESAVLFRDLAEHAGKLDHTPIWRGLVVGIGIGVAIVLAFVLIVIALAQG
jgi:hypothetical protein